MDHIGKDTENVVVGNGEYMRSILNFKGTVITLQTHTFTHVDLKGFTGGVSFLFVDVNGQIIYSSGLVTYGVDGADIPFCTSDRWDTQVYTVDPGIYDKTDQVVILQKYSPQNRFINILESVYTIGKTIWDFFADLSSQGPVYNTDSTDPPPGNPEDYTFESSISDLVQKPAPVLPTPTLVAPANGQRLSNSPRYTSFCWNAVPGADCYKAEVQIGYLSADGVMIWHNAVYLPWDKNTSVSVTFPDAKPGRWRVTANDTTGAHQESAPSSWWMFDYTPLPVLATPTLVTPPDGQRFSNYPRITTVTWDPVPSATSYLVEVPFLDPNANVWVECINKTVAATSFTFNFVGSQPGRWRVTALDENGAHQPSVPSAWRSFDYTPVPILDTPKLVSPADGQHFSIYPRTTTLTWQSVAGANKYSCEVQYGNASGPVITWTNLYDKLETPNTFVTFDFVGSQPGRWRVSASDTSGAHQPSVPSPWLTFDYTPISVLATPVLVSPTDGQHLPVENRAMKLEWQPVLGANDYHVEVDAGGLQFPVPGSTYSVKVGTLPIAGPAPTTVLATSYTLLREEDVTATSLTIKFLASPRGRWRVTAKDNTGAHDPSPTSPWWTFEFA